MMLIGVTLGLLLLGFFIGITAASPERGSISKVPEHFEPGVCADLPARR